MTATANNTDIRSGAGSSVSVWKTDPAHTTVQFSAKHMMITTVRGRFHKVDATLWLDEGDITRSSVSATIDAASIDTGVADRDKHLRSADFLDVEKYPTLTFRSKRIEQTGDGEYRVIGDLTIHGVTREVALDTTFEGRGRDPFGNEKISFAARTTLNRKDFGLTWNVALETGGVLVSDTLKVEIDFQGIKDQSSRLAA
jgi:polyisoprenoid-binding protein YceI